MSEPSRKSQAVRGGQWRPWEMGELPPAPRPEMEDRATQAAEATPQALEDLRERVRQEARDQGSEQGFREGLASGREQGYQEGLEQARREGYAEGFEQGREKGLQIMRAQAAEALAPLGELITHADQALQLLDDDIAAQLVDLALHVGTQLARESLTAKPQRIVGIVRELLHDDPVLSGKPRLWLHPRDLPLVQEHLAIELGAAGWQLQPDADITRGGCRLTCASGEVDATWEERCEAVFRQARKRKRQTAQEAAAEAGETPASEPSAQDKSTAATAKTARKTAVKTVAKTATKAAGKTAKKTVKKAGGEQDT